MMKVIEYLPALPLRNYIRCYSFRELNTEGEDIPRPIHAIDQLFMTFWLCKTPLFSCTPSLFGTDQKVQKVNLNERPLLGIQTSFKGSLNFNGIYRFFTVEFISNGFFRIFNIPVCHLSDRLLHSDDVVGKHTRFLQEQLEESTCAEAMSRAADHFFLNAFYTNLPKANIESITAAAHMIQDSKENLNIKMLASRVNLSIRGLERHFIEQVGISPKLLSRVVRFNKVLQSKMIFPERNWTDIANSYAYFDQMHLIKDFKTFTGQSPNSFLKQLPPPMRERFGKEIH